MPMSVFRTEIRYFGNTDGPKTRLKYRNGLWVPKVPTVVETDTSCRVLAYISRCRIRGHENPERSYLSRRTASSNGFGNRKEPVPILVDVMLTASIYSVLEQFSGRRTSAAMP